MKKSDGTPVMNEIMWGESDIESDNTGDVFAESENTLTGFLL